MAALAKVLAFPAAVKPRPADFLMGYASGFTFAAASPFVVTPDPFVLTPPMPRRQSSGGPRKPRARRKPPVSLSDEQLLALLAKAKEHRERDYVMILTTYWHGLRASETVNLLESDYDLDEGTVQIRRGKGSEGGLQELQRFPDNPLLDERAALGAWLANRGQFGVKGGAKRQAPGSGLRASAGTKKGLLRPLKMRQSTQIVTFSPDEPNTSHFPPSFEGAKEEVGALADEKPAGGSESLPNVPTSLPDPSAAPHTPSQRLFPIDRKSFWRIVHNYALAAGIPRRKCKTHMLKHTIAKHLVRAGHPLNEIQEWMGWTTIETMNWYTRADEEELGHRIGNTIRSKTGLRQVQQGSLF